MTKYKKMSRPKKKIALSFFIFGLILGIFIPWLFSLAATKNPYAIFEVLTIHKINEDTELVTQVDVPYSLAVNFDKLLLEKARQDSHLRVYTQKASAWETARKDGLWAPVYSQSKNIIFHGIGEYSIDLTKIKNNDIIIHADSQTIDIHIPDPELRVIYDEKATEFMDTNNAILRFGEMEIPPEMMSALESEAMRRIKEEIESDADSIKTARDYAAIAIKGFFEPVLKKTLTESNAPYYSLNIIVGDSVIETESESESK